jgi:hypothetical protein
MRPSLEIFKLKKNGEIERRINCLPGRITVFRGHQSDRSQYEAALLGTSQSGQFSVLLGQTPFASTPCNHFGIGSDFAPSYLGSTQEYLAEFQIDAAQCERLLLTNGLGGLQKRRCTELSLEQQRILRLIALEAQPETVHVLSDPFKGLSEQRREEFADRMVKFVAKTQSIIVITQLSDRPQSWIENEYISRVQLERPRSATIGFGSDATKNNDLINKLREENLSGLSAAIKKPEVKSHVTLLASLLAFTITLSLAITLYKHPYLLSGPQTDSKAPTFVLPKQEEVPQQDEGLKEDYFPADIRDAIQTAFLKPDSLLQFKTPEQTNPAPLFEAREPQSALANHQQTFDSVTHPEADSSLDERREEIRRRFLEAIQRAAESQQEPSY